MHVIYIEKKGRYSWQRSLEGKLRLALVVYLAAYFKKINFHFGVYV